MKNFYVIVTALLWLVSSSCSIKNPVSESEPPPSELNSSGEPISTNFSENKLDFNITESGIEILYDDEIMQIIEGDFLEQYKSYNVESDLENSIVLEDFDFDNHKDLFVPEILYRANCPGTYYHFNPTTQLFEEWKELNTIGFLLSPKIEDNMNTLSYTLSGSAIDHETYTYVWQNNNIKMIERSIQYINPKDNEIYIDYFKYDDSNNEKLIKREKAIIDENNNWIGTEIVNIE